jgi:hypothetical protein
MVCGFDLTAEIVAVAFRRLAPRIYQYIPGRWLAWLAAWACTVDRRFGSANCMPPANGAVRRGDRAIRFQFEARQRRRTHGKRRTGVKGEPGRVRLLPSFPSRTYLSLKKGPCDCRVHGEVALEQLLPALQ